MDLCLMMYIVSILAFLISAGWFTLLERKVLSYSQSRVGPNKVGVLTPLVDMIKLMMKHDNYLISVTNLKYLGNSIMKIFTVLLLLSLSYNHSYNWFFYLLIISSVVGYSLMLPALISKTEYSMLGCKRLFAMFITYEIMMFLSMLLIYFMSISCNSAIGMSYNLMISILLLITFTMEMNRHPFEIIEGESELVSGFNIELGGAYFMIFFLGEMLSIMIMTFILCYILGNEMLAGPMLFLIIMSRSSYPRIKMDHMMHLSWTSLLMIMPMLLLMC